MEDKTSHLRVELTSYDSQGLGWVCSGIGHPYVTVQALVEDIGNDRFCKVSNEKWTIENTGGKNRITWLSSDTPKRLLAILELKPAWPVQLRTAIISSLTTIIVASLAMLSQVYPTDETETPTAHTGIPVGERGDISRGDIPRQLDGLYRYAKSH